MKLSAVKNLITSKAGRQILTLQKHSPVLLFGAGIVGVVGTVVLASTATLKVHDILDEHADLLEKIETTESVSYSEDDRKQDKLLLYVQTAGKFAKLYAPAVLIGAASIACLTGSHYILTQRNTGLMAAYAALDKSYRTYRSRVRADVGDDKDREYQYGAEKVTITETTESGKTSKKTTMRAAGDPSGYAKLWGRDTSQSWNPVPDYNMVFLRSNQNWFNDQLRSRGHLFLNEVYEQLGLPHTSAGAVTGWLYKPSDKNHVGDNFVSLNIFDEEMQPKHLDFFSGREEHIWLDFNVDGIIWDKI